ncbi:MAG: radical SAM protein [Desulfobulbaceae bacterium]|nr:radical SAM protein [Desulfobulbaceae bacterium]
MTPFIIPFFIAHQGCPHQCVFCNQHVITGTQAWLTADKVAAEIRECLAWPRDKKRPVQVAFYGGSFTGLETARQEELLGAVQPFLENGAVNAIRLSTRPDYIDRRKAIFLKQKGVAVVELGIQSFDENVLTRCRRGHRADHVEMAFKLLREAGLSVGGQLMVGLPGERTRAVLDGARRLATLAPDMVRIYPTLVLKNSPLADLYSQGNYRPLSLQRAVCLCAQLKMIFEESHIPVIRMGLQPSDSLEKDLVAGPYHPAFGELVLSRLFFRKLRNYLKNLQQMQVGGRMRLLLSRADISLFQGQKKCSVKRLTGLGLLRDIDVIFQAGQQRFMIAHDSAPQNTEPQNLNQ